MNAMSQQRPVAQDTVVQQAVHRPAAVVPEAVIYVVHALRHMDMEAGHAVTGFHHLFKRFVGDREERVAAEHRFDHGIVGFLRPLRKIGVLLNALPGLFLAVPFRYLVAQAGPHAGLFGHIPDCEQGTGNFAEAGMMVEDRRHAVADAVQDRRVRAGFRPVQRQMPVNIPPHAFQNLQEVGGIVPVDRQSPGQPRINMRVRVDQARHNYAARRVNILRLRISLPQRVFLAHGRDLRAVGHHRAVLQIRSLRIPGNHPSVSNQQHIFHALCRLQYTLVIRFHNYEL